MRASSLISLAVLYLSFLQASSFKPLSRDVAHCTPLSTPAPAWAVNTAYKIATLAVFNGTLYQCLQSHTAQSDWVPPLTPDLWATPTPCGVTAWQTQTLYQIGSTVTYGGLTYTCIQGHESLKDWTPGQTPALWQLGSNATPPSPACSVTEFNGVTTQHTEHTSVSSKTGVSITVIVDQTILAGSGPTRGFGGASLGLQVFLGADELISHFTVLSPNGTASGSIHWGPLIQGAKSAFFTVNNGTVSGIIDNRPFTPFKGNASASSLTLIDGGLSPILTASGGVNATMPDLEGVIAVALASCAKALPQSNSTSLILPRSDRLQDFGHFSDTYGTGSCNGCKVGATAAIIAAEIACDAGTCWWSFGLGCVACTAAAALATTAAIEGCEFSSACCPVTCGAGSFPLHPPTCCFGNEACLDGNGHCCSSGQKTCAGKTCCNGDQSCIEAGPQVNSFSCYIFHIPCSQNNYVGSN